MAAKKNKPAKGKGKLRGKMPSKRSINLVLVDENKINPLFAFLGIVLILALAAAFSKFLVIDRLAAMDRAQGKAKRVQDELDRAMDALDNIGDISETYAHYTVDGMTAAELGLVDRLAVLALVDHILPEIEKGPSDEERAAIIASLYRPAPYTGNDTLDSNRNKARNRVLDQLIPVPEYIINKWSLTENLLTLEINGQTLERLNQLGQQLERSPIVNTCTIVTANKDEKREIQDMVAARFIVYLQQPPEGFDLSQISGEEAPAEGEGEEKSLLSDFGKVTQFVGGEASQQ